MAACLCRDAQQSVVNFNCVQAASELSLSCRMVFTLQAQAKLQLHV